MKCEICNKELKEEELQKHLFDVHDILFCQYIGLISDKIKFKDFLVEKNVKKKKVKK